MKNSLMGAWPRSLCLRRCQACSKQEPTKHDTADVALKRHSRRHTILWSRASPASGAAPTTRRAMSSGIRRRRWSSGDSRRA